MKKAIFSLDASLALIMILLAVLWSQGFLSMSFDNANAFGTSYEARAEAVMMASVMNTFYATQPGSSDYLAVTPQARAFKDASPSFTITKTTNGALSVSISSRFSGVSSASPAANVSFNSITRRVAP